MSDISPRVVQGILDRMEAEYAQAHDRLKEIYSRVLGHFAGDLEISDSEVADLRKLKLMLGLTDRDVTECERAALDPHYVGALREMLADHRLTEEERTRLSLLAQRLRLPEMISKQMGRLEMQKLVQQAYDHAISDRQLSPEEETELKSLREHMGASIEMDANSQKALDHFRLLWRIGQGELPVFDVPVVLRRGEQCHADMIVTHSENRTTTRAIRYAGPSVRIRIMKGVYYRAGQANLERVTQELLTPLDSGALYLTNKRLLFNGSKRSASINLSKIIDFKLYSDAIAIEKETGKDQFFQFGAADSMRLELWGALLAAALRADRKGPAR